MITKGDNVLPLGDTTTPTFPMTRIEVSPQGVAIINILSASYSTTTLLRMQEVEAIIHQVYQLKMQQGIESGVIHNLKKKV